MNKNDDLMKIKDKQKVDGASILIYTEESLFKVVSLDLLKPQQQGEEEQSYCFLTYSLHCWIARNLFLQTTSQRQLSDAYSGMKYEKSQIY